MQLLCKKWLQPWEGLGHESSDGLETLELMSP